MGTAREVRSVLVDADGVDQSVIAGRLGSCPLFVEQATGDVHGRIMARPLDPARGQQFRAVLVQDRLVVTAPATGASLRAFAAWLVGAGERAELVPASQRPEFTGSLDWARVGEESGATGVARRTLDHPLPAGSEKVLVAACAVVLARYTGVSSPVVGVDETAVSVAIDETLTIEALTFTEVDEVPAIAVETGDDLPILDEFVSAQAIPVVLRIVSGRLTAGYRADLVDPSAVDWLLSSVRAVLNSDCPIGDIDLLAGRDLASTGQPSTLVDTDHTIHGMVAEQARLRPDAVAVTCGRESLTYAELDDAAGRVAAGLVARGVVVGSKVGVSLPRGVKLIVALLGVLKAGAAYVPLDPNYPAKRLDYMASDAGLVTVVRGDDEDEAPLGELPTTTPDDAAYVIYTSGSTGRPKGVVVDHRNVAALLESTRDFEFGTDDVWTFFHSYAFDFSVWEIWGCLSTGGRLVVVPQELARDPHEFHRMLVEEGVTVLNQTPSAFAQLLSADQDSDRRLAVRLLVFGGEQLDSRMMLRWFDRNPEDRCRAVNMYGITETTVHCTWFTITRQAALAGSKSVGTGIPGWSLRILDAKGRAVPPGVSGEIVVSGAGVTRGYLGQPELTEQRFPTGQNGERRYRSGDRGRLLVTGELEHLGRLDNQVKVRGHRIELGEIKAELLADPTVRAAAVVINHRGADVHLDAYVVGPTAAPAAVRTRLTSSLPAYMVPSTVTVLDELPLTSNGKLDVERLPEPVVSTSATPQGGDGSTEDVGQIWEQLLGNPVGLDDNLFLVGGNSLVAARIAAEIRQRRLGDISVAQIYHNPTIRQLAGVLEAKS